MGYKCECCADLSIQRLVDLIGDDFRPMEFSHGACYRHQSSFDNLEAAASRGCDFCGLVLESFKRTPSSGHQRKPPIQWIRENCDVDASMYVAAKNLPSAEVRICINTTRYHRGASAPLVEILDMIMVQLGPALGSANECPEALLQSPCLSLILANLQGTFLVLEAGETP